MPAENIFHRMMKYPFMEFLLYVGVPIPDLLSLFKRIIFV